MTRWAQVHTASGFVVNVLEFDDTVPLGPPADYELIEDAGHNAGPGMIWDGTNFNFAPPLEPFTAGTLPAEEQPPAT